MTTYALQSPPHAGATLSMVAPGGVTGDQAPTGSGIGLLVNNSGTFITAVTLPLVPTYDGLGIANRVVTIQPASIAMIPLPSSVYGVGTTGVNFSQVTGVTVAAVTVPGT
jgi:hypothetical protein